MWRGGLCSSSSENQKSHRAAMLYARCHEQREWSEWCVSCESGNVSMRGAPLSTLEFQRAPMTLSVPVSHVNDHFARYRLAIFVKSILATHKTHNLQRKLFACTRLGADLGSALPCPCPLFWSLKKETQS